MLKNTLTIENLSVCVAGKKILKNISFTIASGSTHVFMGHNGSGKTTLARTIVGDSSCCVQKGDIFFGGENILSLCPDERACKGIFLAFQNPPAIEGLTVFSFLQQVYNARFATVIDVQDFRNLLYKHMDALCIEKVFAFRDFNTGFSGGEKKRMELLQLLLLKPKLAILDEIDSGLDVDAQKLFVQSILKFKKENPSTVFLCISHNQSFAQKLRADVVHIFNNGSIVSSGDKTFLQKPQVGLL